MPGLDTVEMLGFNLKLIGKKSKKNVLISAGKLSDKEKMLSSIEKLSKLNVSIYATPGTARFLNSKGVPNQELYKILDHREPNIHSFLKDNRLDLIINVLTGNNDYDESSDSNLIRSMAIENGIPLITDVDVAILTIEQLIKKDTEGFYKYKLSDPARPWDMKSEFLEIVQSLGGFASYHAHYDKAYLISMENLRLSMVDMQKKWTLYKHLKENYTFDDLVERISRGVENMIAQGAAYCRTMVDADSTAKTLPMQAALEVKKRYSDRINFDVGVQPLQGVLDPESRRYFEESCEMGDFVGGLPSKDRPLPEKHFDVILSVAKRLNKRVDVHVDQENNPYETETEMLALKTIEHGMEGRVAAVHAISLSAKPPIEQDRIIRVMKQAGVSVICCPSAALSMKQLDMPAPLHNSIAPVPRLLDAGIPVRLGVDNVYDLFMPLVDGDMWFECRLLMEACRFYDLRKVAELACDKTGYG
ncbi:amidohydrolase family protein [Telmatocola sphagniphila]|uniref:Amidohydrolase family protein n=1 Tax=Telmatocola sphagniphila TaxID=1123043 RepID=A0A8E6B953_9BACT|nr:amidohydrolase family protein [Telmatocola sphagniphila]QVL33689.1 amidohydrolase family protein [Telmatocola sphagniphila]